MAAELLIHEVRQQKQDSFLTGSPNEILSGTNPQELTREQAWHIGGTNSLVVRLMREGKLESIKVGKSRRIDRHVLDAWIEADRRR
jgi:excisionase family DNA binding protein